MPIKSRKADVKVISPRRESGRVAAHMAGILRELGEDPTREGLLATPMRAEKALKFLTSGYNEDIAKIVNGAVFNEKCDDMIVVKDIEFFSLCEHHLLPFYGKAHVAYLPKDKIIGLSKIPRLVDVFARRLQVQERMTQQIAECVQEVLDPQGVAVITEARHFCMMMRGVEKQHSSTTASAMLGQFRLRKDTRDEFLSHVRHNGLSNW
ncbi:MAG: GTP cyclohydrolase I FolE [Acidobacteria bacterium]|nr:GTP cyclohydrolase I FolE [Acidobacteriota bacterium]